MTHVVGRKDALIPIRGQQLVQTHKADTRIGYKDVYSAFDLSEAFGRLCCTGNQGKIKLVRSSSSCAILEYLFGLRYSGKRRRQDSPSGRDTWSFQVQYQ